MNLAEFLGQTARRYPDRVGLVWGEQSWSWSQLNKRVELLAEVLAERGVGKGSPVLVQSRNNNQLIESMFACFRLGAIWVPTNFRQAPDDTAWQAQSSGASIMICEPIFADHAAASGIRDVITIGGEGENDFESLIAQASGKSMPQPPIFYDDPCWYFYTSGTTGRPKAAVLTHGQMAFVTVNHICDLMPGLSEEDGSLVVAPLTHGAGMQLLTQVARGAKTIIPGGDRFDPAQVWRLVEQWRVSNMFTVPTILKLLIEDGSLKDFDHSSLRHVIYAGAPMYREDQKRALKALGPVLVQYFGLGEVTGAITVLRPQDHSASDGPEVKIGTCGRARTGMQITIQDQAGTILDPNEEGEICVCGPAVFAGYHDNSEANDAAFRDGWFRTGDLGYLDSDGDLFITGRASDMYISGGSNIYPREIEEKILKHPHIREAVVLGVPDPFWGEIGVAVCVLTCEGELDGDQLSTWLRERIASYKVPKHYEFWDELPKTGYGKVSKKDIAKFIKLPQAVA